MLKILAVMGVFMAGMVVISILSVAIEALLDRFF